jgi:hypothetical protein
MESRVRASANSSFRSDEHSFRQEFCIPFLLDAQGQNGGWGYYPETESRVESTCWAVRALGNVPLRSTDALQRARDYLLASQLKDGSWPSTPGEKRGSWVTSLACGVLSDQKHCDTAIRAGLRWLCEDYPRDSGAWRISIRRLFRFASYSQQDDALRGWGWTPRTSSWVEPTAFALLALQECPVSLRPANASARHELGRALLYDRMCLGGGWNCGNPLVYGVPGEPAVLPSSWALLALRNESPNPKRSASFEWLRQSYQHIISPASRAAASIALQAYGISVPEDLNTLREPFNTRNFLRMTMVVSWVCLALTPERIWLPPKGRAV